MSIKRQRVANRRSKSHIRRLLSELRYYRELLTETKELFFEYDVELNLVLDDITSIVAPISPGSHKDESTEIALSENFEFEDDKEPETVYKNQSSDDSQEDVENLNKISEKQAPQWMKTLFKKIAIETHPDKLQNREDLSNFEKREREILYKKAANAIESVNKMALLETAYVLEIMPIILQREQKEIITRALEEEKNKIASYHKLVSWIWGESAGKTDLRCNLLIYVRKEIGLPEVDSQIISNYILAFENDEDLTEFKKQYVKKKADKRLWRKIGERPAPSFVKSRK